jgi:hypothetical protein
MARPDPLARGEIGHARRLQDNELMTLVEAAAVFWPEGPLKVRSLRTEIANGSLTAGGSPAKIWLHLQLLRKCESDAAPVEAPTFVSPRPKRT